MSLIITIVGIAGFYFVMADFFGRLPADKGPGLRRWFRTWMIKGLLVPLGIWVLLNSAVFDSVPPLIMSVEYGKLNGQWLGALLDVTTLGLFVISTYWAAVTSGWLLAVLSQWTNESRKYRACLLELVGFFVACRGSGHSGVRMAICRVGSDSLAGANPPAGPDTSGRRKSFAHLSTLAP